MRVLILGGTSEGAALAEACAARPEIELISSLAGRTARPRALPGTVRSGGFGGTAGLIDYLQAMAIDRVIDATHPFAARISAQAAEACAALGVPRLHLARPAWRQGEQDRWFALPDAAAAAAALPAHGRRALLTIGQRDLPAFLQVTGVACIVRSIEPPPAALPADLTWLIARGPFTLAGELACFQRHGIDVLVTKASGGAATYAKLRAAAQLGLPVLMIQRPPPPPGPSVASIEAACAWLAAPAS